MPVMALAEATARAPVNFLALVLLIFSRKLSDAKLIHEMDALLTDVLSRGVTLP